MVTAKSPAQGSSPPVNQTPANGIRRRWRRLPEADRGNSDFALVKAILVAERSRKVPVPAVERKLAAIFAADIAGCSR